jgi:PAS domain-containing protein
MQTISKKSIDRLSLAGFGACAAALFVIGVAALRSNPEPLAALPMLAASALLLLVFLALLVTKLLSRTQADDPAGSALPLLKAGALQSAIFNSANFSSIATDAQGVIQIFNVGAERMLGYLAADVVDKITPADISDPQEVIARAKTLTVELETPISPGFEALVFKASRGIEDIYELT